MKPRVSVKTSHSVTQIIIRHLCRIVRNEIYQRQILRMRTCVYTRVRGLRITYNTFSSGKVDGS